MPKLHILNKKPQNLDNFSADEYILTTDTRTHVYNFFLVKTNSNGSKLFSTIGHLEKNDLSEYYNEEKSDHLPGPQECNIEGMRALRAKATFSQYDAPQTNAERFEIKASKAYTTELLNGTKSASYNDFRDKYKKECEEPDSPTSVSKGPGSGSK